MGGALHLDQDMELHSLDLGLQSIHIKLGHRSNKYKSFDVTFSISMPQLNSFVERWMGDRKKKKCAPLESNRERDSRVLGSCAPEDQVDGTNLSSQYQPP